MSRALGRLAVVAMVSLLAPFTCRADVYEPGMAWVYDSPEVLYVVRMVDQHNCYFAMFSLLPKFGDAGYCKFLVEGREVRVDLTYDGVFPNGLALTNLKQLRLVYIPDSDTLMSISTNPTVTFVRMSSESALKLMERR